MNVALRNGVARIWRNPLTHHPVTVEAEPYPRRAPDPAYRPDIDGLRAIAILSVLAFHAFPRLLRGGFVGVDVFFVISGYLITGLILHALSRNRFSFVEFYARRIRRIFPALIVILLTVWGLGWLKLLPDEYSSLNRHIAAGSVYASNWVLYRESGYFNPVAELKPLLHLWSLGVEEQFYIVWPLLLVVIWRWRRLHLPILVGLACASFAYNLAVLKMHAPAAFYLPQARLWELAVGGILAYIQMRLREAEIPAEHLGGVLPRNLAAVAGLALLCISFTVIDASRLFPGWWAVLPVFGTALLIGAGENAWINRHVLASRPFVAIGLISYALYLWHWPLLSLLHIIHAGDLPPAVTLAALAIAFPLSYMTYRYVELPIRAMQPLRRAAVPLFVSLGVIGLLSYAAFIGHAAPLSARYGVDKIVSARSELAFQGPHLQHLPIPGMLTQRAGSEQALFLGDSNLEQYYPRIDELLTHDPLHTRTAIFATGGGCAPIPGVWEAHHAYCDGLVQHAIAYAQQPTVDTVVIGAAWQSYFQDTDSRYDYQFKDQGFSGRLVPDVSSESARRALGALDQMVQTLTRQHKRVVLILQIPVGDDLDPLRMVDRSVLKLGFGINAAPLSRREVMRAVQRVDSQLVAIAKHAGAEIIDPLDSLCGPTTCPTLDENGAPMYRDAGHLRPSYVRANVHFLDDTVVLNGQPFHGMPQIR